MSSTNPSEEQIAAANESMRLLQREHALRQEAHQAFQAEWTSRAAAAGLDEALARYVDSPVSIAVEISDFTSMRHSEVTGVEYYAYDLNAEEHVEISRERAAARAGLSEDVLEDMELPLQHSFRAARPHWEDAVSVRRAAYSAAAESAGQAPAQEWTVTPQRAQAAWVETTTKLRTLIDTGQYTAVRNAVREMDSYMDEYVSGEAPPGSFEEEHLYVDALNRAAVPIESGAPKTVLNEMRERGERVPDFPTPEQFDAATGVMSLRASEVERALMEPGKSPTPRKNETAVFAREWRAATRGFDSGLLVSYDLRDAPGQALVERLDGDLNAYVNAMPAGPGEVILTDVTGNDLDEAELQERLGVSDEGAAAVMSGLKKGLGAASEMRLSGKGSAERLAAVPLADSPEDVIASPEKIADELRREMRAETLPVHQLPASGAAGVAGPA